MREREDTPIKAPTVAQTDTRINEIEIYSHLALAISMLLQAQRPIVK